jgi:dTDP-4-dehydrorhamnose reductase
MSIVCHGISLAPTFGKLPKDNGMSKASLLGTGLNGLVGSRFTQDFAEFYEFENLDVSHPTSPTDITDYHQVLAAFSASSAEAIVHFAAFTDVTKAWEQKDDKNGVVYKVNVQGTENVARAAAVTGKHLIHISTAYVFNGEKEEMYTEEDAMSPIEWYGQTKAWAEEKVQEIGGSWTILRIDQPFRPDAFPRPDTAHRIISGLQAGKLYPQFTNHYFGPTYIPDFARVIDWVVRTKAAGIFHASAGEKWSDYNFACLINDELKLGGSVNEGDLENYLKTLSRPYQRNTSLDCSKLKQVIDFEMRTVKEAVQAIQL